MRARALTIRMDRSGLRFETATGAVTLPSPRPKVECIVAPCTSREVMPVKKSEVKSKERMGMYTCWCHNQNAVGVKILQRLLDVAAKA
jgi:hypothetical protein